MPDLSNARFQNARFSYIQCPILKPASFVSQKRVRDSVKPLRNFDLHLEPLSLSINGRSSQYLHQSYVTDTTNAGLQVLSKCRLTQIKVNEQSKCICNKILVKLKFKFADVNLRQVN